MKAHELANSLDGFVLPSGYAGWHLKDAAAELRRLAEVNAELLGALAVSADLLDERCAGLGAYARSIVAKAKEQQ